MTNNRPVTWYHTNRYNAQAACGHCKGIIRHEPWCVTRSAIVRYAYEIVADSSLLTFSDALMLHSLGVVWETGSQELEPGI